jgi:hypothetical protein
VCLYFAIKFKNYFAPISKPPAAKDGGRRVTNAFQKTIAFLRCLTEQYLGFGGYCLDDGTGISAFPPYFFPDYLFDCGPGMG